MSVPTSTTGTATLAVVSAGLSTPSSTRLLADRLTAATVSALEQRGTTATVEVVELREHARDLADHLLTGFANRSLQAALDTVAEADGLIAVTPVFSASYSGLFKTFADVLQPGALSGTPVLLGATAGSARHSLVLEHAMRPLFAYLRAVVTPTAVFAAPEDWAGGDWAGGDGAGTDGAGIGRDAAALGRRVDRAAAELADLVAGRAAVAAVPSLEGPFGGTPSFEELLRGA
jgi:FMN reductase